VRFEDIDQIAQLTAAKFNNSPVSYENSTNGIVKLIEDLSRYALSTKEFDLNIFIMLAYKLDMNLINIYKLYIGKNVLNKFRLDNGYKLGTYNKMWKGREDNLYMMGIIDKIDGLEDIEYRLSEGLKTIYSQVKEETNGNLR